MQNFSALVEVSKGFMHLPSLGLYAPSKDKNAFTLIKEKMYQLRENAESFP
ncbi:hypothetical protein VITU102760_21565 [Vibrio tubiashii]|uniref:Uncharacterized protein n=1 Tax=Vibrio tubiashii ATCC 19109 TaxID=1051646 RepID=A0ABN0DBU4_9VIBR|nr:hypothetical protein VITU9109_08246 [Vibrio tubiashii ATCC 19109]